MVRTFENLYTFPLASWTYSSRFGGVEFLKSDLTSRFTIDNTHMGWLRMVGSLKLYVSFAEYRLFYMAPLQKRPIISRRLRIVATLSCAVYRQFILTMSLYTGIKSKTTICV